MHNLGPESLTADVCRSPVYAPATRSACHPSVPAPCASSWPSVAVSDHGSLLDLIQSDRVLCPCSLPDAHDPQHIFCQRGTKWVRIYVIGKTRDIQILSVSDFQLGDSTSICPLGTDCSLPCCWVRHSDLANSIIHNQKNTSLLKFDASVGRGVVFPCVA
jgi:hypothetical protein